MPITAATAAPLIRHIVAYHIMPVTNWHGSHIVKNKKVLIANDVYADSPCSCWWIIINKPVSPRDIMLKEVRGVLLAHLGAQVAIVDNLKTGPFKALADDTSRRSIFSKKGRHNIANGMFNQLDQAVRSGAYAVAKHTAQEFSLGLDKAYFIAGGAAFFEDQGNSVRIYMSTYNKEDFDQNFHQAINADSLWVKGGVKSSVLFTRKNAKGGRRFRYTPDPGTITT